MNKIIKLLISVSLFFTPALSFGQAVLVDDSWIHGVGKVTLTTSSDNVGIGSIAPGQKLDVQGTGRFSGTISASNFSGSTSGSNTGDQDLSGLVPKTTTVNGHALSTNVTVTATDLGLGNVENTKLSTWPGSSNITTVGNLTANVGIGSATPGQALDVVGNVRATNFIGSLTGTASGNLTSSGVSANTYRSVTVASTGLVTAGSNPTTFSGYAISDTSANLRTALSDEVGTGFAVFNASPNFTGNIGIGSTNAGQSLDVQGTIRGLDFSGIKPSDIPTLNQSTTGNAATATALAANGTNCSAGNYPLGVDASGNAESCTGAPTECSGSACNLNTSTTLNSQGICLANGTNCPASSGTNYWTKYAANIGIGTTLTNVGIGSTNPGQMLDVGGTIRALDFSGIKASDIPTLNQNTSGTAANLSGTPTLPNGTAATTQSQADGSTKLATTAYVDTGLATKQASGSYLTTIAPITLSGSNVGIGSVTPGQVLDVNGTVRAIAFVKRGGTSSQFLKADGSIDSNTYSTGSGSVGSGTNFDLAYYNGTGTSLSGASNVYTNGTNVGIGTYNFNNAFDVDGGVGIGNAANSSYLTNTVPAGSLIVQNNVGIGSLQPGQLLDVQGTVRSLGFTGNGSNITNLPITLTTTGSSGASTYTQSTNTLNIPQYTSGGAGSSLWETNSVGIDTFQPNVGLGSTNPGQRLDVQGTIRGLSLFVSTSGTYPNFNTPAIALQTAPNANDWEDDGTNPYFTPSGGSARGGIPAIQYMALTSPNTMASSSAQAIFNVGTSTNGTVAVQSSTTYYFEMQLYITAMSGTTGTASTNFATSGTIGSIRYTALANHSLAVDGTPGTATMVNVDSASAEIVVATATTTTAVLYETGIIRVTTGGTLTPEISFSHSSTPVIAANSYFEIYPIGTNTTTATEPGIV